jgi:hypothetical protein
VSDTITKVRALPGTLCPVGAERNVPYGLSNHHKIV